jgi:hypothetical protein
MAVGVAEIDRQQARLFGLLNELEDALSRDAGMRLVRPLFSELVHEEFNAKVAELVHMLDTEGSEQAAKEKQPVRALLDCEARAGRRSTRMDHALARRNRLMRTPRLTVARCGPTER